MWSAGICAEPTGLVVLEGLLQLGARVHHERPVGRDGLADRLAPEDQHLEGPVRESWVSLAARTR